MKLIAGLLILTSILFLVTTCCDDCPSCPEPETEEHLFYIAPDYGNLVKIFSVEREAFIDSIRVDGIGIDKVMLVHVIGNDSLLMASTGSRGYIIDLETKEIVGSFTGYANTFSRNSRFYYDYRESGENVWRGELYLYPENELIFSDIYWSGYSKFSNHSEIFTYQYIKDLTGPRELGFYNILGGTFSHSIKTWNGYEVGIYASQAVEGLKKVFVDIDVRDGLAVCDFGSDTLRSLKHFPYGFTTLVVGIDEKYVYFTDWGPTAFGYVPTGHIYVWDAVTEDSVAAIPFTGIEEADMLVLTYDNKYLLTRPFNATHEFSTFCVIDAQKFEVIGSYDCGIPIGNVAAKYCIRDVNGH